jgi:hypothetical protein
MQFTERDLAFLDRLGLLSVFRDDPELEGGFSSILRSRIKRLLPRLRRRPLLVHVTSVSGFNGIQQSGAILPNDGTYPDTFPQSARSSSRRLEAVALFDFATPTPLQFVEQFFKCEGHFWIHHPATLALLIQSDRIASRLIRYEEATEKLRYGPTKIPHLEVWSRSPIPFDLVESVVLLRDDPLRFRTFSPENLGLAKAEGLMSRTWPHLKPPRTPKERHDSFWSDYFAGLSKKQQDEVARVLTRIQRNRRGKDLPGGEN